MPPGADYRIQPIQGYTPRISDLIGMLNYSRQTTLDAVAGLSVAQLDFFHGENGNSIGALLAHIVSLKLIYSIRTLEERLPSADEKAEWDASIRLGKVAREKYNGLPVAYYQELLEGVRQRTLTGLARCDDDWLNREFTLTDGSLVNNYWAWFHVVEDEVSHRGQILLIRNHLMPEEP
ncbi:DinB family protein [Deinococcus marmoris]|uniref:DinB family protein n=1 Tax=Deinococcus marmoris TaxID=249408 RepID=UPI0012DD4DF8|nr:DinB family protein [Deinococcus marmoris]